MKKVNLNHWKRQALAASVLVSAAVAGYTTVNASNGSTIEQTATSTPAPTITPAATSTSTAPTTRQTGNAPGGRGRGGHGGDRELQGLDTNPPEVELAPEQSSVEPEQSTELADGAQYYDGQYYGDEVSAGHWGTMQVVAVIEDGKLTDVLIAAYPHSTYESDIITRNALPTLISEAIEAQDSDVDTVSRATDSSKAFVKSLDSALLDAAIGMDL